MSEEGSSNRDKIKEEEKDKSQAEEVGSQPQEPANRAATPTPASASASASDETDSGADQTPKPEPEKVSDAVSKPILPKKPAPPERVTTIQFRSLGKVYLYDAKNLELNKGDRVIVETERGLGFAEVIVPPAPYAGQREPEDGFRRIIRRANKKDLAYHEKNVAREQEAFVYCKKKIEEERLEMKLVEVTYLHSGGKAIFSFSSEARVDFRNLVKDLAQKFHTRIEMRQIGVRDQSKIIGGVGHCGRQLCCASWIRDFSPVSIKMAKDQNLSLNPVKVSGVCGRLLCCLGYEAQNYRELTKCMPRVGRKVDTPQGPGEVTNIDVFKRLVSVHLEEGGYVKFKQEEVCPCQRKKRE